MWSGYPWFTSTTCWLLWRDLIRQISKRLNRQPSAAFSLESPMAVKTFCASHSPLMESLLRKRKYKRKSSRNFCNCERSWRLYPTLIILLVQTIFNGFLLWLINLSASVFVPKQRYWDYGKDNDHINVPEETAISLVLAYWIKVSMLATLMCMQQTTVWLTITFPLWWQAWSLSNDFPIFINGCSCTMPTTKRTVVWVVQSVSSLNHWT